MVDRGIGSGGALPWFFQRLTGILLAPILIVHLLTMHKWTAHGLPWDQVALRLTNPYWKVLEVFFLTFALYHGLNGLYAIIGDYVRKPALRLTIFSLACVAGVVLLIFGLVTVFSLTPASLRATL
jgi:succinate dehydrogenase hydrophobic membrane anchor protein